MSWQIETHERRLDRFEQSLRGAQFDSMFVTCRSKAEESRACGAGEVEDPDDPILSLLEVLAHRIDGLERIATDLSEELLAGNRRICRMHSQSGLMSALFLPLGLLAGAWVKYSTGPPDAISRTSVAHKVLSGPAAWRMP